MTSSEHLLKYVLAEEVMNPAEGGRIGFGATPEYVRRLVADTS